MTASDGVLSPRQEMRAALKAAMARRALTRMGAPRESEKHGAARVLFRTPRTRLPRSHRGGRGGVAQTNPED
ncbi:hypothetical protein GCM10029978_027950 [Actinoallomurus acanthiterrae]